MSFCFKNQWDLYKAKKAFRNQKRPYLIDLKKAKKNGESEAEINCICAEMDGVCQNYKFEVDVLEARRLVKRANKLQVPVPSYNNKEMWEHVFNYRFLTKKGKLHLINIIRKEKRERVGVFFKRASIVIGLIGALTAFITVLK